MVQLASNITGFECGCVWLWYSGQPGPQNHNWQVQCDPHARQPKPADALGRTCTCLNVGEDDGATTCWQHHDCFKGECTHMDND